MKEEKLTNNGIEKLIGGVNGVIVQLLAVAIKNRNGQKFYGCELSDGYCKLKSCLVVDEKIFTQNKPMKQFLVIQVTRCMVQQNKAKEPIVVVEDYKSYTDQVRGVIGQPLYYDEYIKKGKKNPQGNNIFEIPTNKERGQSKYDDLIQDTRQEGEEETTINQNTKGQTNSRAVSKQKQIKEVNKNQSNVQKPSKTQTANNIKGGLRLSNEEDTHTNLTNPIKQNTMTNKNSINNKTNQASNQASNQISKNSIKPKGDQSSSMPAPKTENRLKTGPIQKIKEPIRNSPNVRGNQSRPNNQYNEIKSLFAGMENFVVLARVLFVNPIKTFINKKGVQSSLQTIEIGDRTGTIECSMFGEVAQKFEGKFTQDQLYQIANAIVVENTYLGHHELKITINEMTRVSLRQDDPSVPLSQDFCISVKQLLDVPVGETVRVICLIKDNSSPETIITKAGKEMRKKTIQLCDPIQKVQVEATIWGDRCQQTFQRQPYMLKGVNVNQFKGYRQYSLKGNFATRILKYHNLRRYIKDFQSIPFSNPDSAKKKKGLISNFKEINNMMDEINENGTWSEVVCYLSSLKTMSKNYYLACPNCKKKVIDEVDGQCGNCSKPYETAKFKYIVQFQLCDYYDTIWATAYDQPGEKMLGIPASEYAKLKEDELQQLAKNVKHKEFKLKLVTKSEEYNNNINKKTNIINVMPLNYAEQTKSLLNKLTQMLEG